jgi:hypothetical protein
LRGRKEAEVHVIKQSHENRAGHPLDVCSRVAPVAGSGIEELDR